MKTQHPEVPLVEELLTRSATGTTGRATAPEEVAAMAAQVTGRRVDPGPLVVRPVPYAFGSPATGGLFRVGGRDRDGRPWSLFVKVLQHVRHWPGLNAMPADFGRQFAAEFPWRDELDLFSTAFAERLPPGMRVPRLGRISELGDDRVAVWMEDVTADSGEWSTDRFARAARLLGRFAARGSAPHVLARSPYPPNFGLRMYAERAVPARGLAPLTDDDLWRRPRLAGEGRLRERLLHYGSRVADLLAELGTLDQAMPHGDASPQNLLVPISAPEQFVLIDIAFTSPHVLGFDLGQLLVGLVHADQMPPDRLPQVAAAIVPAYAAGLADEGHPASVDQVRHGFVASVLLRSGLDSMRYDLVDDDDPASASTFSHRVALTRFLLDLADDTLGSPS